MCAKRGRGEDVVKNFKYKLPFDCNFIYRHAVDDHNNLIHALPSIEDTWMTDRWECGAFALILAISEVNGFLILHYFVYYGLRWEGIPMLLDFFRNLAWQLISNIYVGKREGGGWVLVRPHYSIDECTNARKKISDSELDLRCKKRLSTVQLQL